MSIIVTSKKFKAADWYNSDGGISYLNGCVNDKTILTLDFYIEKTATFKRLKFDATSKTITNFNNLDYDSFIQIGYQVGETIITPSSSSNKDPYTITAVTDRVITVAESLVNEIVESTSIYLTSAITALDFYYNIKNNPQGNKSDFISLQDVKYIQKYSVSGLDATDTSTVNDFNISSPSYDWVTDTLTGNVSQCTIIGLGVVNHKQAFRIVHTFFQTPLWTKELLNNFSNQIAPDNYLNDNAPTYTYALFAKYNSDSPNTSATFFDATTTSNSAWFNQNNKRVIPEYSFNTIQYENAADSSVLSEIDITKIIDVTLTLTSASGLFTNSSQFILNFIYCALTHANYQNPINVLRKNQLNDRAIVSHTGGSVNGEFYGTGIQVLNGVTVTIVDTHNATLNFQTSFHPTVKNLFAALSPEDLNYAITVTCQNQAITSSESIDRINVLCDFNNAFYDTNDATLLNLVDYLRVYNYPDFGTTPFNNVKGREGDLFYVDVPFQLTNASLKTASVQIVASKSGKQDFILEGKTFNLSQNCDYNSAQQINASQDRNYKTFKNNPYNVISIQNDPTFDDVDTGKVGYIFHYPFVLRYEDWLPLIISNSAPCPDLQNDVKNLTQKWKNISDAGWSLNLRFNAEAIGSNGNVTPYQAQTGITIVARNAAPDSGTNFTPQIFLLDENDNQINAIVKAGITKVVALFTGDFTNYAAGTDLLNGFLIADLQDNSGGVNGRRLANTNISSESDSPWLAPPFNPNAFSSWSQGNVTMNLFKDAYGNPTSLSVEGYYKDTSSIFSTNLSNQVGCGVTLPTLVIHGGVAYIPPGVSGIARQWSDGTTAHNWSDTSPATWH